MFIHLEKGPSFEDFQNECLAYNLKNGHCALHVHSFAFVDPKAAE